MAMRAVNREEAAVAGISPFVDDPSATFAELD